LPAHNAAETEPGRARAARVGLAGGAGPGRPPDTVDEGTDPVSARTQSQPRTVDRTVQPLHRVSAQTGARGAGGCSALVANTGGVRHPAGGMRGIDVPRVHPDRPAAPIQTAD